MMPSNSTSSSHETKDPHQRLPAIITTSPAAGPHIAATAVENDSSFHHNTQHKRGLSNDAHSLSESNASSHPGADVVGPEDQRVKKRRTGPGSRGVANLTPEQLAKKRANDREAQRAIRERTKNQIESLERRIRELTSQQPYQELQALIRAKEAVEAENAEIKNKLASVLSLIQSILTSQHQQQQSQREQQDQYQDQEEALLSLADESVSSPLSALSSAPAAPPSIDAVVNVTTPPSTASPAASTDPSSTYASPKFHHRRRIDGPRQSLLHNLDLGAGENLKLDFLLDPAMSQKVNRMQTGVNGAQDSPIYSHLPMKHDWTAISFSQQHRPASRGHHQSQRHHHLKPPHDAWVGLSAPIKNCAPTCPLDSLLLDFLHERRQRAAEGVPTQEIIGPRYPSVSSLLNPADSVYSHPLSKVFTDILATFPGICTLPERVAVLYIMFLIMRWQISPTKENYDLLPCWVTPVPSQIYKAHPAWIDHLPFQRMREKIAREYNPAEYFFENFFTPFTTTLSLNWPYEATDCILQSPDGDELLINPVFERHMRNNENWTLGDAFHQAFPQLAGTYNLKGRLGVGVNRPSGSVGRGRDMPRRGSIA